MSDEESRLEPSPLIAKLTKASGTYSIAQFAGYLAVPEDGVVRLFDDLSLRSYVELRSDDVIEVVVLTPSAGVSRHKVFVPGSATVRRVSVVASRAIDLEGDGSISSCCGPSGGFVRRVNNRDYYESGEYYAGNPLAAAACRNYHTDRISGLNDTIDVLEGINTNGSYDGLIAQLREQIRDNEHQRSRC